MSYSFVDLGSHYSVPAFSRIPVWYRNQIKESLSRCHYCMILAARKDLAWTFPRPPFPPRSG